MDRMAESEAAGSSAGAAGTEPSGDLSALMLRLVLDGETYEAVGARYGITRTAVERRVKSLASRLCKGGRVPGMTESATVFVSRLRAGKGELLKALEDYRPGEPSAERSGDVISEAEIQAGVSRILRRSPDPLRDAAMFYLLFVTGLRPLEVARLRVDDYLNQDGSVRRVSVLPAAASTPGRARPLYFASDRLNDLLGRYLAERVERGHGDGEPGSYRGLDPDGGLFLMPRGAAFSVLVSGPPEARRFLCRPILESYRKIFRWAGLPGATPLSVRRTVVARLYERGADEDQVGKVLGISSRRAVRELLARVGPELDSLVVNLA